jgi:hypothetical protein
MHDVRPDQYPTVIREIIRHENDLTNHRIMSLLIGEGFIANAYVIKNEAASRILTPSATSMFVSLWAFVMLYRSYQTRGYLRFWARKPNRGRCERNTCQS